MKPNDKNGAVDFHTRKKNFILHGSIFVYFVATFNERV